MAGALMRVLVTRPAEEGERLAQLMRERGHEPILSPAIDIHFENGPELSLDGVQAILVTSANCVRALAARTTQRNVPVFAVGPQTAQAASAAGFVAVRDANGDSDALAQRICQWASPRGGPLIYAAGDAATDDLVSRLRQQGFNVEVRQLYRTSERATLSDAAAAALGSERVDAVMLFSPRSARAFLGQVVRAGLQKECRKLQGLCISPAVADALHSLHFAGIRVASQPNRDSMLDLLV
jgi:uroporphyrinogen-III synthase